MTKMHSPSQDELERTTDLIGELNMFLDDVGASQEEAMRIFVFMISRIIADLCDTDEELDKMLADVAGVVDSHTRLHRHLNKMSSDTHAMTAN